MAHPRQWSTTGTFLALGLGILGILGGCGQRRDPAPGELELEVSPGASFGVVGRFHLAGIDPDTASHDLAFDATTTRVHVELPPGDYVLTLEAGAALVCPGKQAPLENALGAERLVSTWPQRIAIASGVRTRAHIDYGLPPTAPPTPHPPPPDPCGAIEPDGGAQAALRQELNGPR